MGTLSSNLWVISIRFHPEDSEKSLGFSFPLCSGENIDSPRLLWEPEEISVYINRLKQIQVLILIIL